jgi:hypothetical protein
MPHLGWQSETVKVTSLDRPETECYGRVADEGGNRILLLIPRRLPACASVQIDGPGFLVLGDVCYCEPAGAEYVVYIKVAHVAPNSYLLAAKSS